MTKIANALKGIGGEFEIQRILGAVGTLMYVVSVPAFIWAGKITATLDTFCLTCRRALASASVRRQALSPSKIVR